MAITADQITGPLRAIIPALVAYAAGRGWIPDGDYVTPLVAIITGASAMWSIWTNRSGVVEK